MIARALAVLVLAGTVGGCGDADPATSALPALSVRNQTQVSLLELRVHDAPSYLDATNELAAPLPPGATMRLARAPVHLYVTAIRLTVQDGAPVAFTTAYPLEVDSGHWVLEVFEHEFRVRRASQ
jgi:hypothetical protein